MVLRFKIYGLVMTVFAPNRTKRLLSGDDRAASEVILHKNLYKMGSGLKG